MKATTSRLQEIPAIAARHSAAPEASRLNATPRRGRPSKFGRSARAITVTLPEDVITTLMSMNLDVGRAIVQLCEAHASQISGALPPPVEVSSYGAGALILIAPVGTLKRVPGVELIPLTDGRALISLDEPRSLQTLELDVRDALESNDLPPEERPALSGLADVLRSARQGQGVSLRTRTIIVLEPARRPKPAAR
jgi:hypothetical protein